VLRAADNRYVMWAILPKPTGQKRSIMQTGVGTNFTAQTSINILNKVVSFSYYGTANTDYSFAISDTTNLSSSRVLPLSNPTAGVNDVVSYGVFSENDSVGAGILAYQVDIPASAWTSEGNTGVTRAIIAEIPLPAGAVLTSESVVFAYPHGMPQTSTDANYCLAAGAGNWQSLQCVYVNSGTGAAYLRLPEFAMPVRGLTSWGFIICEKSFLPNATSDSGTFVVAADYMSKLNGVAGPSKLEFGPGYQTWRSFTDGATIPLAPPPPYWVKQWFILGQNFEADRNPYAISGIDMAPSQTLQLHLTRNEAANAGTAKIDMSKYIDVTDSAQGSATRYIESNPADQVNTGGWPVMVTRAFFVHDRTATLRNGLYGKIIR
jgi:hypothetical protein